MYIEEVKNRNSPPAILLRESYRENGKVIKKTIANLTKVPKNAVEALKASLKGIPLCPVNEVFRIESSRSAGHVMAISKAMKKLDIAGLVSSKPCPEQKIVLGMIAHRLIDPCSKLATAIRMKNTSLCTEFNLPEDLDENDIYKAMDWLVHRQPYIEKKLASRHLSNGGMAFYDLSCSSYHGDHCPLAKFGYNRDGLKLKAVEYGLLTDKEGRPISIQIYPGNVGDPTTVPDQATKLASTFGLDHIVIVGDRGMLTQAQISKLKENSNLGWISCLRSSDIEKIISSVDTNQMLLFSQEKIAEITHDSFPGERLILCYNPLLAEERRRKREELLQETETNLAKIKAAAERRKKKPWSDAELGEKIGARIDKHNMGKHITRTIGNGTFTFERNNDSIEDEKKLDGYYVIRTSVPKEKLSAGDAVRTYKSLGNVEKAFRTFKGVDIRIRPIHHHTEERVQAHIFLCMLAYYVEWHMRKALSSLMYVEDDLARARQERDPVAKAVPTEEAKRKKKTGLSSDGFQLHDWRSLISSMSTLTLNTIVFKGGITIDKLTETNAFQKKVFDLLDADSAIWTWNCTQKEEEKNTP